MAWIYISVNILFIICLLITSKKRNLIANIISFNIGFIIYLISNLIIFMFVFQKYQGESLMGIERYLQTYLIAMTLNIIFIILENKENINKRCKVIKTIMLLFVIINIFPYQPQYLSTNPMLLYKINIGMKTQQKANEIIENTKPTDKIYIIDQKQDYGREFMEVRYLISPRKTNLLYEWNIGEDEKEIYYLPITSEELLNKILIENYDYVYIISADKTFEKEYKNIFSKGARKLLEKIAVEEKMDYTRAKGLLLKVDKENRKLIEIEQRRLGLIK